MDEEQDKKDYEISFLLKIPEAAGEIDKILTAEEAEIFNRSQIREIQLAYPIKKQKSAYFGFYHFRSSPAAIKKISEDLDLKNEVIRFLVITPPYFRKKSAIQERLEGKPIIPSEMPLPQILSNEALEKKLEEILK